MDLPINEYELDAIIDELIRAGRFQISDKLILVRDLMKESKPYKKILREEHGIVA
jgi:hypothetical protein